MDMRDFSVFNRRRCESAKGFNHPVGSWSLSDWMTATMGELGEAANIAKKLNRVRDGIPGNDKTEEELRAALAEELADAFIYLDLLAQSQGIVLADAVIDKFNRTSEKIGYDNKLFRRSSDGGSREGAAAVDAPAPEATPKAAWERHNEITRQIMTLLIQRVVEGGDAGEILIILESVFMGCFLSMVKLGRDEAVFDAMIDRVRKRLAEQRLGPIPPKGSA